MFRNAYAFRAKFTRTGSGRGLRPDFAVAPEPLVAGDDTSPTPRLIHEKVGGSDQRTGAAT